MTKSPPKQPEIVIVTSEERANRLRGMLYMVAEMSDRDFALCSGFIGDVFALKGVDITPFDMEFEDIEIEDIYRYVGMRLQ